VGPGYLEAIVKHGAATARVPIAIMLDHGSSLQSCLRSILNGHSAVMIDASHESFDDNIQITREVCTLAHLLDVIVEGELGTVRRTFETTGSYAEQTIFTDPYQVPEFVKDTGVDSLAISIGTESGIPNAEPRLDFELLREISSSTDAYIVLHGGSGIRGEDVCLSVENGVTAFRFASEIRIAYLDALQAARTALPADYPDTRLIFGPAREAAKEKILTRMEQLGCAGKAW
jgi:fructose-bisphosphate aldolase class II